MWKASTYKACLIEFVWVITNNQGKPFEDHRPSCSYIWWLIRETENINNKNHNVQVRQGMKMFVCISVGRWESTWNNKLLTKLAINSWICCPAATFFDCRSSMMSVLVKRLKETAFKRFTGNSGKLCKNLKKVGQWGWGLGQWEY